MSTLAIAILWCGLAQDAPAAAPRTAPDALAAWSDLASPWYEVRRRAQARLESSEPREAAAMALALLGSADRRQRMAGIDAMIAAIDHGADSVAADPAVLAAMRGETDPAVRARLVHLLARRPALIAPLRDAVGRQEFPRRDFDSILEERLLVLAEQTMHEGRVPGFFDGQFAALLALDASAAARMLRFAWSPNLHIVMRVMMTMGLQEGRPKDLEAMLTPLVIHADREVAILDDDARLRRTLSAQDIRLILAAKLSQYARFSMAKAGIDGPIHEKIDALESSATRLLADYEDFKERLGRADRALVADNEKLALYLLDNAMDCRFEIGYHQQQLDRYDDAEIAYRTILAREEPLRAKKWAHYNLACIRAIQGRNDEAIAELEAGVKDGFDDLSWARRDGDLKVLKGDPRFLLLLSGVLPERKP